MSETNNHRNRRKYDPAFKADVLKMVESGRPIREIAQSLGISENLIYQWRSRSKSEKGHLEDPGSRNELLAANERLRAELKRTEQERDILKKALSIWRPK